MCSYFFECPIFKPVYGNPLFKPVKLALRSNEKVKEFTCSNRPPHPVNSSSDIKKNSFPEEGRRNLGKTSCIVMFFFTSSSISKGGCFGKYCILIVG